MPRLQLSEAEAAFILKSRAKNAGIIGFNEGLDHAVAVLKTERQYIDSTYSVIESSPILAALDRIEKDLIDDKKPELLP